MSPKFFLVLISIIIHLNTRCQDKNYKVSYRHCLQTDTTKFLMDTMGLEAILIGNINSSNYVFAKKPSIIQKGENKNSKTLTQIFEEKTSGSSNMKIGIPFDEMGNQVFFNKKVDSVFLREKMMGVYICTFEKTPKMNWIIGTETKQINKFNCTVATATFKGRNYTAWFTSEIPISEGPWKFKGLPGLILSIEDDKRQVKIYATSIEYPTIENVPIFYSIGKKIDKKEYVFFRENESIALQKKMEQAILSQEHFSELNLKYKVTKKGAQFGIEKTID